MPEYPRFGTPVIVQLSLTMMLAYGIVASGGPAVAEFRRTIAFTEIPQTSSTGGTSTGPLRACGRALCVGDSRFQWHGVTAFGLVASIAAGRSEKARAFVEWAHRTGFNVLRVLAMLPNGGWLDLAPADGRRVLPQVFAMARESGMYVQVVALANTNEKSGRYATASFLQEQVREVGRLCAAAGNCVLEVANEPYHRSQARLNDPALMARLQEQVPRSLPTTWGAGEGNRWRAMGGGTFVVVHLPRSGDRWARVARIRDLEALSAATGKFVVDNEPIGAAEAPERDRRDSAPEAFFAQGAVSRIAEVGSTFHCQDCLRAEVPGPVQQRCADAFVKGRSTVPEGVTVRFADGASTPLPVSVDAGQDRSVFSGIAGDRSWTVRLGDAAGQRALRWRGGWRPEQRVEAFSGVEIWTAVR
jgi:hypothetical protein